MLYIVIYKLRLRSAIVFNIFLGPSCECIDLSPLFFFFFFFFVGLVFLYLLL
jgi:hypothetical protein